MNRAPGFDIIVLAGDRGPGDPLAQRQSVAGKVLVRLLGQTLLGRVLEAVAALDGAVTIWLVSPTAPEYRQEFEQRVPAPLRGGLIPPAAGPAASVVDALKRRPDRNRPALVVTGDHPLLRPSWLKEFVAAARGTGAAAVVGVADADAVMRRFPGSRRTRYRFSDRRVCGTNLFWFDGKRGIAVAELWRSFERDRKRPWRVVARLGPTVLLRYLFGRLSLAGATRALSRQLGVPLAAVLVRDPEAAVDVDSLADLALAEQVLAERSADAKGSA